jgi:nucleoside-diphosphate-sugar epimerase
MNDRDRILVTGATGFIGARLVETLARRGHRVRVTTSDFRHCVRVARFPVELVKADLCDPPSLARAVEGCDTIFHLAYRFGGRPADERRANLDGTRALAEAAAARRVRRFVHFSSVATYGPAFDGDLTEATAQRPSAQSYAKTKLRIEAMLQELHANRGLPLTILQPTFVYGPFGGYFTSRMIQQVTSGRIALPAGRNGLCNAVYVDDVVNAALLASQSDAAAGETFLISAERPVTWREFYGAYEQMAGRDAVVFMDDAEIAAAHRREGAQRRFGRRLYNALARRPHVRERLLGLPPQRWVVRGGRALLPRAAQQRIVNSYERFWKVSSPVAENLYVPDSDTCALYASRTHVRIDKARKTLGFVPAFDLESGMAKTALWARWANLLPA